MVEVGIVINKSNAEEIMLKCLIINDYMTTVKKALLFDGQNIEGFQDHYTDLIDLVLSINWSPRKLEATSSCPPCDPFGANPRGSRVN